MARKLRHFKRGTLYEITIRTDQGRFSLAPKVDLIKELTGIFDEGVERTKLAICFAISMSTHMHLIVAPIDANQMGRWASFCFAQSARAAQFHHRLRGRIWGRRFRAIPILDEAALERRIAYLMAQACCEGADLVEKPAYWVGLNATDAACRGVDMVGFYLTAELRRRAVRAGKSMSEMYDNSPHRRVLRLAPVPWIGQTPHAQQAWFRRIEKKVIAEARARRPAGKRFRHPEAFRRLNPQQVATTFRPSPAPDCHSSCAKRKTEFRDAWRQFCSLWRAAMARFKRGLPVCFPPGGWRPFNCEAVLPVQLE